MDRDEFAAAGNRRHFWTGIALLAIGLGALLRFWHLGYWSMSHPEVYIPGIDLIPGISEPPPRHQFVETLSWHFHDEPHPPGYYMAMWAWTKIAGTSEVALRLPGAAIGAATIWFVYRLGCATFGRRVGAVAALLLAFNGFHIYWSQMARMYAPGAALAVLSTWALVAWARAGERRPWLELGYGAALIAGTQTDELFWAVPALHLVWAALVVQPAGNGGRRWWIRPWEAGAVRIVQVQSIAIALASPEFVHAALLARHGAAPSPAPRFLVEYLSFGFLFESDPLVSSFANPPLIAEMALAVLTGALVAFGMRASGARVSPRLPGPLAFSWPAAAALIGSATALVLAAISERHRGALALFAVLPVLCLWLPVLAGQGRSLLARWVPASGRWLAATSPFGLLLLMLAIVPPLFFYAVSLHISVLATRAFLPFVPFLLVLVAAGLVKLATRPWIGAAMAATLGMLSALSCVYFLDRPHSPRDYRALAATLEHQVGPTDVILVRRRNWADTPLFYYMPRAHYVTEDSEMAYLAQHHPANVWELQWLDGDAIPAQQMTPGLNADGYAEVGFWSAQGGRVALFHPRSQTRPITRRARG